MYASFPPPLIEELSFAAVAKDKDALIYRPGYQVAIQNDSDTNARPLFYLAADNTLAGDADPGAYYKPAATDVLVRLPPLEWMCIAFTVAKSAVERGDVVAHDPVDFGQVAPRAANKPVSGVALWDAAVGEVVGVVTGGYIPALKHAATSTGESIAVGDALSVTTNTADHDDITDSAGGGAYFQALAAVAVSTAAGVIAARTI